MDRIVELLNPIPIPKMVKVRQKFTAPELTDVAAAVDQALLQANILNKISPHDQVAIAVGSRGISQIPVIVKQVVNAVKSQGANPFIVPAMGSHGAATAEGQKDVLTKLGVTEQVIGAEIRSNMDVVEVGRLKEGPRIYVDKHAYSADKVIVINRIKPHTAFDGPIESGLMKMITIGLGKQKGAESVHQFGFGQMASYVPKIAKVILEKVPIIFGLASIENAYERPAKIVAVPAERLEEIEPILLKEAKTLMPRLLFQQMDVLVIDEIGKDISGSGLDPHITGRFPTPYKANLNGTNASRVVILNLTDKTDGNANGIGFGDITTQTVFKKIIWEKGYFNALTSTVVQAVKVPMFLPTERLAVQAGIKTCNAPDFNQVRLVRIKNTLDIKEIWISESMLEEALQMDEIEVITERVDMEFQDDHS